MKENMKKRLIAFLCIICMVSSLFLHVAPATAEASESEGVTTLEEARKNELQGFSKWTFSDTGIEPGTLSSNVHMGDDYASYIIGNSLDKTLFSGKINFPSDSSNFGTFYVGGASDSKWRGFLFRADGTDKLKLHFAGTSGIFYNAQGNAGTTDNLASGIAVFDSTTAGTTLRGNDNLQVSFSVEYTATTDTTTTLKVGVFFDGKLYNNTYYTVKDVPSECLKQTIRFSAPQGIVVDSYYLPSLITLETAPEKAFTHWTFSNAGIEPGTLSSSVHMGDDHASYIIGDSLDKTIFHGKINFPKATAFGNFYIGGASDSKWRGFIFTPSGDENIKLAFIGSGGYRYNANGQVGTDDTNANAIAILNSQTAGTTLRGNSNLEFSFSVEYTETTDTTATLKVGVFFDGNLYNDVYFTVKDVPLECLKQTIRIYNPSGIVIDSCYKTLQSARENELQGFSKWTFENAGINDDTYSSNVHMGDDYASYIIGDSLDKTLFNGKVNFPSTNDFGVFYIGGASNSKWRGFMFRADGTDKLRLHFAGDGGNIYNANGSNGATDTLATAIAVFDSTTAGTTLRGNDNLQVSFSVEYTATTDTTATLKVGVFFDGKLYNNTYYTVKDVPTECLKQTIRFSAPSGIVVASQYLPSLVTLETAPEKEFAHWTFSNVGIAPGTLSSSVHMGDDHASYIIGDSLDKTIFHGKINFPETSGIGTFYIGGASDSRWRGFMFREEGTDGLKLHFAGPDVFYNANGVVTGDTNANAVAVFDSATAGTDLRGNSNLQVSLSVEYAETTDTTATLKVGVFFDGNLYNDTYYTVKEVPLAYLKQTIRIYNPSGVAIASAEVIDTIVQPEITDSIAMNYITTIDTRFAGEDAPTMAFTVDGETTDAITGTLQDGSSNTYVFTYPNIMAQDMADTITATVTVGKYTKTYNYSVLDYCVDVLETETLTGYSAEQMEELKNLIVDLVQYGAEVQKYRNTSIADAELLTTKLSEKVADYATYDKTDDASLDELSGVVATKLSGTTSETYQWTGVNLVLGNKAKIRAQFKASDISNLTVKATIGNSEEMACEINGADGTYYVDFDNIYAYEYAKEIQIKFYNGETPVGQTLHYSVNTYLDSKKNVTELQTLLLAINNFGDAADSYNTSLNAAN